MLLDIVSVRVQANCPAIFIDGRRLRDPYDTKTKIIEVLGLTCSWDEFLDALDAAGEASGSRALLVIDGLNECDPDKRQRWREALPTLFKSVVKHSYIGLAASYRSAYKTDVLDERTEDWPSVSHNGFGNFTEDAVRKYFHRYGLVFPAGPILSPEFSNGLYLKCLCRACKNEGLTEIPVRTLGFSWVFEILLKDVQNRICDTIGRGEDRNVPFVKEFLINFRNEMGISQRWVPNRRAMELSLTSASSMRGEDSLLGCLVKDGWLYDFRSEESDELVFGFAFNRFEDHLVAEGLISQYKTKQEVMHALRPTGELRALLIRPEVSYDLGVLESICLVLGEKFQIELVDHLSPEFDWHISRPWTKSLRWRSAGSVSEDCLRSISKLSADEFNEVLPILISWVADGNFVMDLTRLDHWLNEMSMLDRDACWSVQVEDEGDESFSIVRRIIDWSRSEHAIQSDEDTARRISGLLGWFTTVPTAQIRDAATKGMVNLCFQKVEVAISILKRFSEINDSGILERVSQAAYGAALRSGSCDYILKLADYTWCNYFRAIEPPVNILTRDSLRGILKLALTYPDERPFSLADVNRSFGSSWSLKGVPTADKLRSLDEKSGDDRFRTLIISRLDEHDILEKIYSCPRISSNPFTTKKVSSKRPLTADEKRERLEQVLEPAERALYDELCDILDRLVLLHRASIKDAHLGAAMEERFEETASELESQLSEEKAKIVLKLLTGRSSGTSVDLDYPEFPDENVQRWVVSKVIGWKCLDSAVSQIDEDRMRYQVGDSDHWKGLYANKYVRLAFMEAKARLADTFWAKQSYDDRLGYYECWQGYDREIDPSVVSWGKDWRWQDFPYDAWESQASDPEWIETHDDLPELVEDLVSELESAEWIALENSRSWSKKEDPDEKYASPKRIVNRFINAVVWKKADGNAVREWYKSADLWGSGHHSGPSTHSAYLGEIGWSEASANSSYHNEDESDWKSLFGSHARIKLLDVSWSKAEDDRSIEFGRALSAPCRSLTAFLGLRLQGEAKWIDGDGNLVAMDPSGASNERSQLLIRKEQFLKYLDHFDLSFGWEIQEEKMVTEGNGPTMISQRSGLLTLHNGKIRLEDLRTETLDRRKPR